MPADYQKLKLKYNPFDPTGAGTPVKGELWFSEDMKSKVKEFIDDYQDGQGAKIMVIIGEYGMGKTCLLRWLQREVFPSEFILPFYFDNPGVQFYDLANTLLRTIGRKDFAKLIWELVGSYKKPPRQGNLFGDDFENYISSPGRKEDKMLIMKWLQEGMLESGITKDEEIAYCFARLVTSTVEKPYFEYQDFLSGRKNNLVPEGEEAPYFNAILKTIRKGKNADAIAFLIDEFEEIGLQKSLTKRAAHGYLATLKRLINIAHAEGDNFWLILSMTAEAYEATTKLEPALKDRGSYEIKMEGLKDYEAKELMCSRIGPARLENGNNDRDGNNEKHIDIFPFPEEILFSPTIYGNPRRLVRTCFHAISHSDIGTEVPFTESYLRDVESKLYNM